jgi:hypothetical protein
MFNNEAKLKTILFQQFLYICHDYNIIYYSFIIFWLKFIMGSLNIFDLRTIIFNLMPSPLNEDNTFYFKIRESLKK